MLKLSFRQHFLFNGDSIPNGININILVISYAII